MWKQIKEFIKGPPPTEPPIKQPHVYNRVQLFLTLTDGTVVEGKIFEDQPYDDGTIRYLFKAKKLAESYLSKTKDQMIALSEDKYIPMIQVREIEIREIAPRIVP